MYRRNMLLRSCTIAVVVMLASCQAIGGIEERILIAQDDTASSSDGTSTGSGASSAETSAVTGGETGTGGDATAGTAGGDGGDGGGGSPASSGGGGADPCGEVDDPADIWVDPDPEVGDDAATGTECRPFRSITKGLAVLADSAAASRTLHLAAGEYIAPAETFPLHFDGPLTIVGAGIGGVGEVATLVRGSAPFDPAGIGQRPVTAVAHTRDGVVEIRDVAFVPDAELGPDDRSAALGVACVDGNVPTDGDPPGEDLEGSLRLQGIFAGGFAVGVGAFGSADGGCYLELRGSELSDNEDAVWSWGIGSYAAVRVGGPEPSDGNWFHHNVDVGDFSAGVTLWSGTSLAHIEGNEFESNEVGVQDLISRPSDGSPVPDVTIADNRFSGNVHSGLFVVVEGWVSSLERNLYEGNAKGVALLTYGGAEVAPTIARARDNVFEDNVIGLLIQSQEGAPFGPSSRSDFGTPGDAGENVFRCNDIDVFLDAVADDPIQLAGNQWDHVPIATWSGATCPFGTDLFEYLTSTATYDASGAVVAVDACD